MRSTGQQAGRLVGTVWLLVIGALLTSATSAFAEVPADIGRRVVAPLDSGLRQNRTDVTQSLFKETVRVAGAPWIRLVFDQVNLGPGSSLRITSLADGAVQDLDSVGLQQWSNTSAFFNGEAVSIELLGGPNTILNSVSVSEVMIGEEPVTERTICDAIDDRVSSEEPAVGRMLLSNLTSGCTATIFSPGGCLVTAGHCTSQTVLQFQVPPSLLNGALQHPGPENQYTMDTSTLVFSNAGIGFDWGLYRCFPNTQTGLTVYEAQGEFIPFAEQLPTLPAEIDIYGYGSDDGVDNQTQQYSTGPISSYSGSAIYHRADTTGGNSGSAILSAATGEIIGIHTNAGCGDGTGSNSGTSITNTQLQDALAAQLIPISLPNGPVAVVHPSDGAVLQALIESGCDVPVSVALMVRVDGGAYAPIAMTNVGGDLYEGTIPGAPCESSIDYYVEVVAGSGTLITDPPGAPASAHSAVVATSSTFVVSLDFETAVGWAVSGSVTDGPWQRGVPVLPADRGNPPSDFDGSGQCWVTDNVVGNSDVDGGSTILTSPLYDLSGLTDPYVGYARWYHNSFGAAPFSDVMTVEVSNNDGGSWVTLETVGPTGPEVSGGWIKKTLRIGDTIAPTATMRFRFTASDLGEGSVVEAGVDAFELFDIDCAATICGDFDQDGDVDTGDFAVFGQCFGGSGQPPAPACPAGVDADCDGDTDVDTGDFAIFAQNFTGSM